MRKKISKIILFFVFFIQVVYASELNLTSEKYVLYNMNDNMVLTSKDENVKTSIASLTKIMTIIVSIENIDDYDKKIKITKDMLKDIDWDVSVVGFKVGESVSYNDLLYGAMLPSGADAVNALAISISGNKKDFINLMNEKVQELGLKNTHFDNVVGLYSEKNYSSAYDMAQILIYSLKNPKFKSVFETKSYTFSNGKKTKSTIAYYNEKNKDDISYITGSKTGYIKKAGLCLASTATLHDVNYLLVTLNAFTSESAAHVKDHVKTYTYYDKNYGYKNIINEDDIIVSLKTKYAKENNINIKSDINKNLYLKNDFDRSKIKYDYDGLDTVSYFTKPGSKLGHVKVLYGETVLEEFDLIYNEKLTFSLISFIIINEYYLIAIGVIILLILISIVIKQKRRKISSK